MAVLLTWALFAAWAVAGLAVLRLGRHRWGVTTLLFAPTVGLAALAVPVYALVRFGLPVRTTAVPVVAALLAAALLVLWRARPSAARAGRLWRRTWPFAAVLAGAFVLVGWPLGAYGFDWVAAGNDDMGNYCMVATGYRDHAFAEPPTLADLDEGRDPTRVYWFMYILHQVRSGSETTLAATSAWTGLSVQQVFMPVIVAFHLALVAAAGGLAATGAGRRGGLAAAALLAVSAATAYGVVWQLIAQVAGLALLCTSLGLVSGRFRRVRAGVLLPRAAACGVAFAGLLLFYPEVIPILVGGCVVLGVRELARRRLDRRHLAHAGAAIAVMAGLLPVYLLGAASFLLEQAEHGGGGSDAAVQLFPYFLTPRAAALFWGLLPIAGAESEMLQNVCIVLGFVLLAALLRPALGGVRRNWSFAAALAVVGALAVSLYASRAAFGLFKLAMFAQPFLWAVVGAWAVSRRGRWAARAAVVALVAVGALNARTQFWYVDQSCGAAHRVELPSATTRHAMSEFRTALARERAAGEVDRVYLVTENTTLSKLLATELRGVPIRPLGVGFEYMVFGGLGAFEVSPWVRLHPGRAGDLPAMREQVTARREHNRVAVRDPETGEPLHRLTASQVERDGPPERALVVAGAGGVSILNRHAFPEAGPVIACVRMSELRNFAAFCDATGARHFYLGMGSPGIAMFQLEADPIFPGRTMAGASRALVVDVINPTPQVRVLVSATGSFHTDPDARAAPNVQVIGDRRVPVGAVGNGCARLVSPPVAPQAVGPGRFLALHFGEPVRNPNQLAAAERLWGANLPRDRRWLSGHLRDVSVLSEEEYAAFTPPARLARFPDDLLHPHAEYSGFVEDGWVGKESKVRLTQARSDDEVVFKGHIPVVPDGGPDFRTELTVLVDGREVGTRALGVGMFEFRAPAGAAPGPRWVECRFSRELRFPAPDGRRAVAHVRSIGIEPRDEARSRPPARLAAFPDDLSHPKLEQSGVFVDGWTGPVFRARLSAAPGAEVVVRGTVPGITPEFRTGVAVLLDGAAVAEREVGNGDFEIRAPAGAAPGPRWVEVRVSRPQTLPAPDGRTAGVFLKALGFEPAQ